MKRSFKLIITISVIFLFSCASPASYEMVRPSPYKKYSPYKIEGDDFGTNVYSPDQCIGPVIMGECKGAIVPKGGYHEKCYGDWVGGECTGPQF